MSKQYFRKNFSRMGGIVNVSLENLGLRHKILEIQAMSKWKEVVGKQIADVTLPERVRDGVLFVCCKSSIWSNELTFHKLDIVKRLNIAVGKKDTITDIRFSARGYKRALEGTQKEEGSTRVKGLEAVPVAEEETQAVSKLASGAPSQELAAKIQKAVLTSKRMEQVKIQEGWKRCKKCSALHSGDSDFCVLCK